MANDIYTVSIQYQSENYDQAAQQLENFRQSVTGSTQAERQSSQASDRNTQSKQRLTRATRDVNSAQQRARQQFLATANSIAVLDGPLGGIASRFSAFGVLIGRIGIPLAGLAIGLSTLGFAVNRAVREFAEFEVQVATIENRLSSVGNRINLTSQEIVNMSNQIAQTTLADEREVLRAANSLLTFRRISTDAFEDVLRAAQDLSASGFGGLESNATRLAKALEDPRQSLNSLSRAGVTFSRQQSQMIISMIDMGREAEAMRIILQGVERQVGGAGLAQANNTLAGTMDTVRQGMRQLIRDAGELASETGPFRVLADVLFSASAAYLEFSRELSRDEIVEDAVDRINRALEETENRSAQIEDITHAIKAAVDSLGLSYEMLNVSRDHEGAIEAAEEVLSLIERQSELLEAQANAQENFNRLSRRQESLEDLRLQLDLQRESIGLTEEQIRVNRMLADAGLSVGSWRDINREVTEYRDNLTASGIEAGIVHTLVERFRVSLQGARTIADELTKAFEDQARAREINRIIEGTRETNELLVAQVRYLRTLDEEQQKNITATELRRRVEVQLQLEKLKTEKKTLQAAAAMAVLKGNADEAATAFARIAEIASAIANITENIEISEFLGRFFQENRSTGSGGGGGGGRAGPDPNEQYQRELDALVQYLERRREEMMIAEGLERELLFEQYQVRFQTLQDALDRELITKSDHAEKVIALQQSLAERLNEIDRISYAQRMSDAASFFGSLAGIAQAGGNGLVKAVAAFRGIEAVINAWSAYNQVLADPSFIGRPWARVAAAANVLAAGLNAVSQIRSAGGGGSGGAASTSTSSASASRASPSSATANAPATQAQQPAQTVLIQGLDSDALYTGEQLQNIFDAFYDENQNRGVIFVVQQ